MRRPGVGSPRFRAESLPEYAFFGERARFHHVGLAVRSIREVNPSLDVIPDESIGVSMAFFTVNGITIELLEPLGDRSPIAQSLHEGKKLVHLCYEVPDLEEALELCRPEGFHRINRPHPEPAYDNRRVVWVFSKHYGLFELLEGRGPTESEQNEERSARD